MRETSKEITGFKLNLTPNSLIVNECIDRSTIKVNESFSPAVYFSFLSFYFF